MLDGNILLKTRYKMNSIIFFRKKTLINFNYIKLGDVFRSGDCDRLKVFIEGKIKDIEYLESFKRYKIRVNILFYDLKEREIKEEIYVQYVTNQSKLKMKIVGVYRNIY